MWVCEKCGTSNSNNTHQCSSCGAEKTEPGKEKKTVSPAIIGLLAVVVIMAAVIVILAFGRYFDPGNELSVETGLPTPSPSPTLTPSPSPPPPTEGTSTAGTRLIDIVYDGEGRILSLKEHNGDKWIDWTYKYSSGGSFLYRMKNIGTVQTKSTWNKKKMPGTDTHYWDLTKSVDNVVQVTLEYRVTKLRRGTCAGRRDFYVRAGGTWELLGAFDYSKTNQMVTNTFSLSQPSTVNAICAPRQNSDDISSFDPFLKLLDVWVADYEYVTVELNSTEVSEPAAREAADAP